MRLSAPWGGPLAPTGKTGAAVYCCLCGWWDGLTLVDGRFYCRDTRRCTSLARAPEKVRELLLERLEGLGGGKGGASHE